MGERLWPGLMRRGRKMVAWFDASMIRGRKMLREYPNIARKYIETCKSFFFLSFSLSGSSGRGQSAPVVASKVSNRRAGFYAGRWAGRDLIGCCGNPHSPRPVASGTPKLAHSKYIS